ncbi:MAG: hypothetical protein C4K60_07065 [Ideonella sp. MAG2]|nr:MAG: hypothetical protein C4K60_07065 [Ideonella sp. MAG2]
MTHNPFTQPLANTRSELPACERFEATSHLWSQPELDALALAVAARRPLLVRGEPGSGKSQLARAAAKLLEAQAPLVQVIHPRFEPRDLLYRYDTIRRLADANTPKGLKGDQDYVHHGVLWRAWESAAKGPVVVLIDEIDKGDADVPNSLLEILGQRSFQVDEAQDMSTPKLAAHAMPLVVITTNEERELPAAFVRRCVVLNLNPPKGEKELKDWLLQRVQAHQSLAASLHPDVLNRAIDQVLADRGDAEREGQPRVGLAETLDLLTALGEVTKTFTGPERATKQHEWLDRLSAYALVKHAGVDPGQRRPPVPMKQAEDASAG